MAQDKKAASVADRLRQAVAASGISYRELGRRAQVDPAQLSRFMALGRDLTLAVASRLCEVLGLELVQTGTLGSEPLPDPTQTTRGREGQEPVTTYPRGQGRRMDLPPERRGGGEAGRGEQRGSGQATPGQGPTTEGTGTPDEPGIAKDQAGDRGAKKPARRRRKAEGGAGAEQG